MSLAQLLKAHGDPVKVAEALGMPAPVVAPAPSVATLPLASPTLSPAATVPLNVDRIALTPSAAGGPALNLSAAPIAAPPAAMPAALKPSWMDWAKAHALWILAALLLLLIYLATRERSGKRASGFHPSPIGKGRMVKGSPEARAHMASLRSRRK